MEIVVREIHANKSIGAFKIDVTILWTAQTNPPNSAQLSHFNNATRHHYSFIHSVSQSDIGDGLYFLSVSILFTLHTFLLQATGKMRFQMKLREQKEKRKKAIWNIIQLNLKKTKVLGWLRFSNKFLTLKNIDFFWKWATFYWVFFSTNLNLAI